MLANSGSPISPTCLNCSFFNYKFIYFNWRLITLQYCIGFPMHQHESATGVHVFPSWTPLPHSSPYHPSGSSQCTSPKHPVSCIEPGLATRFIHDILHVSMPFSKIIPPSPSPTESKMYLSTLAISSVQFSPVTQSWFFATPWNCSTPGFPVCHQLPELA